MTVEYSRIHGPGNHGVDRGVERMNCQAWVHKDLRTLGIELPPTMLSLEIVTDEERFFRTLQEGEPYRQGDVFAFGRDDVTDFRRLHLAIHSGNWDGAGDPILTHANSIEKTVSWWPLRRFVGEPRYAKLFAVKRPLALETQSR